MPRKPKVEQIPRERIARRAKSEAADRMKGELAPLPALPALTSPVKRSPTKSRLPTPKKTLKTKASSQSSAEPKTLTDLKSQRGFAAMVVRAIDENNDRRGTTLQTIYKFVEANYEVKDSYKRYIRAALARLLAANHVRYGNSRLRFVFVKPTKKVSPPKKLVVKAERAPKKITHRSSSTPEAAKKTRSTAEKSPRASTRGKAKAGRTSSAAATPSRGTQNTTSETKTSSSSGKLVWAWQYYDNGFFNYDEEASRIVEGVYQEYMHSPYTCDVRSVKSGQWEYMIDFRQMTQRNLRHESHTERDIRRMQIPVEELGDRKKRYEGKPADSTA